MAEKDSNRPMLSGEGSSISTWFKEFFSQFQLAWNLLWDERVPFVAKLIPMATVLYLLLPIDLIPDPALGLGQLDDLAIFLIGLKLFVDVCPPELVRMYRYGTARPQQRPSWPTEDGEPIIDLEARMPEDETTRSTPESEEA